jgi:hypothetical protein
MPLVVHKLHQVGALQLRLYVRAHSFDAQPSCWRNFVLSIHPPSLTHSETVAEIKRRLATYDATWEAQYVQFASAEHMWQWILTYE